MIVTCVICKFYNNGTCHRYPPIMTKVDLFRWMAQHPEVAETDYCGEAIQDIKKYPDIRTP